MMTSRLICIFYFTWITLTLFPSSSIFGKNSCERIKFKKEKIAQIFNENNFSGLERVRNLNTVKSFYNDQDSIPVDSLCPKFLLEATYYLSLSELYQGIYFQIPQRVNRFFQFLKETEQLSEIERSQYQEKLYTLLGEYHLELKNYPKAREEFYKSYQLATDEIPSIDDIRRVNCFINYGYALALSTKNSDSLNIALAKIDSALTMLKRVTPLDSLSYKRANAYAKLYKARSNIRKFELKKNPEYLSIAKQLVDSLDNLGPITDRISLMVTHNQAEIYLLQGKNNLADKKLKALIEVWDINSNASNKELVKYYSNHISDLFRIAIRLDDNSTVHKLYKSYIETETGKQNWFLNQYDNAQANTFKLTSKMQEKTNALANKTAVLTFTNKKLITSNKGLTQAKDSLQISIMVNGIILFLFLFFIGYTIFDFRKEKKKIKLEKEQLENEIGTIKKNKEEADRQKEFLRLLHENSGALNKFIEDEETNSDFNLFVQQATNRTFELAKTPLDFDTFGIGIYNKENQAIQLYWKEVRQGQEEIQPNNSVTYSLKTDKESLPVMVFSNKNTSKILEGNYAKEGYKKYFDKLPTTKRGRHSSSIIYIKIGNFGVITIQSEQTDLYNSEQVELLETIGENIFNAINSIGNSIKVKKINKALEDKKEHLTILQRDTSHRIKNHLAALVSSINFQMKHSNAKDNSQIQKELLKVKSRTQAVSVVHKMVHQNYGVKDQSKQKWISPQVYFTDLANQFFIKGLGYSKTQVALNILLTEEPDMNIEILKDLGTVIVELGLNIYEHAYSDKEEHWVGLQIENIQKNKRNFLKIIIADKGAGIKANKSGQSTGTAGHILINKLINRLKGKIVGEYYDKDNLAGTKFIIHIPKT